MKMLQKGLSHVLCSVQRTPALMLGNQASSRGAKQPCMSVLVAWTRALAFHES